MFRRFVSIILVLLIAVSLSNVPFAGAQDTPPYWPTEAWRTSTPEEQGMDSAQLLAALDYVEANELPIDSITVIRNGYVVLDAYYHPYTADMKHHIWTATESFTTTLVGIAVDQGLMGGIDQPLLTLFSDRTVANRSAHKEALTIGNLLTMSSGITCGPTDSLWQSILDAPDALGYLLDLKIELPPGSFSYCSLNSNILTGAVEAAAGMPILDFADQYLLSPLGISDYQWQTLPQGTPFGGLGLHLTPHDMARLGYLYLNGGQWAGEQLVSSDWVDTVTCADPTQCPFFDNAQSWSTIAGTQIGYGYHWWMYPSFYITGIGGILGGQFIAVAPEHDMVIVVTSRSKADQHDVSSIPLALIADRIIGAANADGPLPANADALVALDARVDALANPPTLTVEPLPEKAAQVSGVDYDLAPPIQMWTLAPALGDYLYGWPMQVNAFTLGFDQPDEATLELEFSDGHRLTLPVGLDGISRVTETRIGPLALTGQWAPTGQGFTMNLDFVGAGEQRQLSFGVLGNRVMFICQNLATDAVQPPATAQPRE